MGPYIEKTNCTKCLCSELGSSIQAPGALSGPPHRCQQGKRQNLKGRRIHSAGTPALSQSWSWEFIFKCIMKVAWAGKLPPKMTQPINWSTKQAQSTTQNYLVVGFQWLNAGSCGQNQATLVAVVGCVPNHSLVIVHLSAVSGWFWRLSSTSSPPQSALHQVSQQVLWPSLKDR